jgi:GMP synthase (glutamine-hydrolysing)
MKRAVILMHEELEGPGDLEPALRGAGFELIHRYREVRPLDEGSDLLVVMGGSMAAYDADRHRFLSAELDLLRGRLSEGRPTLGICLGAQLLAAAAGARVHPGTRGLELGAGPIALTPQGAADPIFLPLPVGTIFAHWHQDTFDPVPGGVRLASSERYSEQAFKVGQSYGIQFHPEVGPEMFDGWIRAAPEDVRRSGRTLQQIVELDLPQLRASRPQAQRLLDRLAAHFARVCGGPAAH